jgi:hypothetical protein
MDQSRLFPMSVSLSFTVLSRIAGIDEYPRRGGDMALARRRAQPPAAASTSPTGTGATKRKAGWPRVGAMSRGWSRGGRCVDDSRQGNGVGGYRAVASSGVTERVGWGGDVNILILFDIYII